MKNISKPLLAIFLITLFSSGCAHFPSDIDIDTFTGRSVRTLEEARTNGKSKTVSLAYDKAFDKVTAILKRSGISIFQSNRKKRYIVAMNLPKQVNTTRIGVFFEPLQNGNTKIIITSLSSTALSKAENIIFNRIN